MIRRSAVTVFAIAAAGAALAQPPGQRAESPAATDIPETLREQSYPEDQVEAGRSLFVSQCGFCHGVDTAGGSGGPDLTRSELVARDYHGDEIGPVVRAGRLDAEVPMPAFPGIDADDLEAMVAFIHDQKARAETVEGGRRAVSAEDVQSGDVGAGRRYFADNCAGCHSADGDLAGIAARMEGLALMRRMLNPRLEGGVSTRGTPRARVTTASGESFSGLVDYEDEFTIAITDTASGRYRSFPKHAVDYAVDDPLERHLELLGEYTEENLHDVLTYLHTLR